MPPSAGGAAWLRGSHGQRQGSGRAFCRGTDRKGVRCYPRRVPLERQPCAAAQKQPRAVGAPWGGCGLPLHNRSPSLAAGPFHSGATGGPPSAPRDLTRTAPATESTLNSKVAWAWKGRHQPQSSTCWRQAHLLIPFLSTEPHSDGFEEEREMKFSGRTTSSAKPLHSQVTVVRELPPFWARGWTAWRDP